MKSLLFFAVLDVATIFSCSPHGVAHQTSDALEPISISYEGEVQNNVAKKAFNTSNKLNANYVKSIKDFATKFYLNNDDEEKNSIFSPLNIATCFSMLHEGASGETKTEIENVLGYDGSFSPKEEVQKMLLNTARSTEKTYLDQAQSCWVNKRAEVSDEFKTTLGNNYFAEVVKEDFDNYEVARKDLANWTNKKTRDFLNVKPDDFDFINESTIVALLNTIYLKSQWQYKFEEKNNRNDVFHGLHGDNNSQEFMHLKLKGYIQNDENFMISRLDYSDGIYINFLLPNLNEDASSVLKNKDNIDKLLNYQRSGLEKDISYSVPKFEIRQKYDLIPTFKKMGVKKVFKPGAELGLMGGGFVDNAQHAAGIKVDNEGVEAAAYTVVTTTKGSMTYNFNIDRPFAYSICNRDGLPLFMGTVYDL